MTNGTTRPLRGAEHEILLALRLHGPSTRADLVERTHLSRATVSAVTTRLPASGRIESMGTTPSRRAVGRHPERLALSLSGSVILGVEFGHRRVTVTAMNEAHRLEGTASADYENDTSWPRRVRHAFSLMDELGVLGAREVIAVGLGVPGRIPDGDAVAQSLVATFSSRVAREVRVDNNARLAGLAESVWGSGQDLQSFVYLRLMDGVGGALITHGTIYDGLHGSAGEFGHMTVDPSGPECRCGKHGCLEAYVSREQVLAATAHRDLDSLREVLDAGDERRQEIVAGAGRRIGMVLANVAPPWMWRVWCSAEISWAWGTISPVRSRRRSPRTSCRLEHTASPSPGRIRQVDGALGAIALLLRDHTIALTAPASSARPQPAQKGRISS